MAGFSRGTETKRLGALVCLTAVSCMAHSASCQKEHVTLLPSYSTEHVHSAHIHSCWLQHVYVTPQACLYTLLVLS